jgi:hypothetical protein
LRFAVIFHFHAKNLTFFNFFIVLVSLCYVEDKNVENVKKDGPTCGSYIIND